MTLPTFLVIGAAKAGTSSLYTYLSEHPDVFMAPGKETNFFALEGTVVDFRGPGDHAEINRNSVTELDAYERLFAGATTEHALGEASPLYLYSPAAPVNIRRHVPDARLIAVLRDPADRAFASYAHLRRDGREPCADFADALRLEDERMAQGWEFQWHYTAVGRYSEQLRRYFELFPRDQVRVYTFEELSEDVDAVIADIFGFIGVDASFRPDTSRRYNVSGVPRSRAAQDFLVGAQWPRQLARRLLPARTRHRLFVSLYQRNLTRLALEPAVRGQLVDGYLDEITALEQLLGRDLSRWRRRE